MSVFIDLTGQRFGRLVVQVRYTNPDKRRVRWMCECDCGTIKDVTTEQLRSGGTKSCGCLKKELVIQRRTKHSQTGSPEFYSWCHMRQRCLNPKNAKYPRYGGRGITICARWLESFSNFLEDMGIKPTPQHSLDRVDPDGNYEPSNCRWATPTEQTDNKACSIREMWKGEMRTLPQICRLEGKATKQVYQLIKKYHKPLAEAIHRAKPSKKTA